MGKALFLSAAFLVFFSPIHAQTPEWDVKTELVTELPTISSNSPPFWEYHQPIVVRHGEKVYATIMETYDGGTPPYNKQWSLYERTETGWRRAYSSPKEQQINQAPLILIDKEGILHLFACPQGVFTHFRFDTKGNVGNPTLETPGIGFTEYFPWLGGSVNADGDILVTMLTYRDPKQYFMFRDATTGRWSRGIVTTYASRPESPTGYDRHCYPFVILSGYEAHLYSTQDIDDPVKIARGDSYTFTYRKLDYYYTPDIRNTPFMALNLINIEDTQNGFVHNDDMLLDRSGKIHFLYYHQPEEKKPPIYLMHAFGPPGGPLTHVALPSGSIEGRLWQAPGGTLYTVFPGNDDLRLSSLAENGTLNEKPVPLGVSPGKGLSAYFGIRSFLVPSRAVSSGSPFLEGLYKAPVTPGMDAIRYFRVLFRTPAGAGGLAGDFDSSGEVNFDDFFLFAAAFGTDNGLFDLTGDGRVGLEDFFVFAEAFGKRAP